MTILWNDASPETQDAKVAALKRKWMHILAWPIAIVLAVWIVIWLGKITQ